MEKSRWSLSIKVRKYKNPRFIYVTCKSQPIKNIEEEWNSNTFYEDIHPFTWIISDEVKGNKLINKPDFYLLDNDPMITKGVYKEYVKNSKVANAIIDTLSDPKKIDKSSGHTDWRWHRATLVYMLHMLWD